MTNTNPAADVVRQFFGAFGTGDMAALLALFSSDAEIVAVRPGERAAAEIYGTYRGPDAARDFIANLGATLQTKSFEVESVVGDDHVAFASGTFVHTVKTTGRDFASHWALRCDVAGGKISTYRFYEDSAAFVRAAA